MWCVLLLAPSPALPCLGGDVDVGREVEDGFLGWEGGVYVCVGCTSVVVRRWESKVCVRVFTI